MFKLLKLELKKQFKSPITIMVIIVLLMLMISLVFVYSPQPTENNFEINTNLTADEVYSQYYNDSFKIYDELESTKGILSYYNNLKRRQDKIWQLDNDIKIAYQNLSILIDRGNIEDINKQSMFLYDNLLEYCHLLTSFDDIYNINYINTIAGSDIYINNSYFARMRDITANIESYINNDSAYGNKTYTLLTNSSYESILTKATEIATNFVTYTIDNIYTSVLNSFNEYQQYIKSTTIRDFSSITADKRLSSLIENFNYFKQIYGDLQQFSSDMILCKKEVIKNLDELIETSDNILSLTANSRQGHQEIISKLLDKQFISKLKEFTQSYTIIMLDDNSVQELNLYLNSALENYEVNENDINSYYAKNDSISLQETIYKQNNLLSSVATVINNSIILKCYENYNLYEKYIDENEIYTYKCETTLAKYYIINNTYSANILENYQFNYQVNNSITCYDYIVFALQIATAIIILYLIVNACTSISGESRNGTLSMTLMSPYKRTSIINSKMLSTFIMVLLMLIVSLITSAITGILVLGEETLDIVTIFNADRIITISPAISIFLNFICQLLYCLGFMAIVYLITVIFKSYPISLLVSTITIAISVILSKVKWSVLSLLPTNNFIFTKYFNAYFYSSDNLLNKIFDTVTYSSQDFFLSLAIYIVTMMVIYIATVVLFKKKSY